MSTAKSMRIQHPKKGVISLGQLSKNELCRAVADLSNTIAAAKNYQIDLMDLLDNYVEGYDV